MFSVSLGAILTPKRNWRQCLCKILEWPTKSIMVCYDIFCSGQLRWSYMWIKNIIYISCRLHLHPHSFQLFEAVHSLKSLFRLVNTNQRGLAKRTFQNLNWQSLFSLSSLPSHHNSFTIFTIKHTVEALVSYHLGNSKKSSLLGQKQFIQLSNNLRLCYPQLV